MTGRFRQALTEMRKSKKGRKGKMPKNFSVSSGDKSKAGGLTKKGVRRYRAANPGSKLKTAVTTKPSKLKKGSKSAKRRKSFCKRMGGMKKKLTSKKTARNPDSRINKALRKWNCSTDVNPNALQQIAEMVLEAISDPEGRHEKAEARTARSKFAGMPRANQLRRAEHERAQKASRAAKQAKKAGLQVASTEIVRNARQGLAEMILNAIQENDALGKRPRAGQAARAKKAKEDGETPKPRHTRRDSLELKGTVTPNQPDYVRKKLYNRPTKGSTMPGDDPGDATEREPITSINKRGMTNKSPARKRRWARKQDRITKAADRASSYADAEYKDILKGGDSDFN